MSTVTQGQCFGKWTVIRETQAVYGGRLRGIWDCRCDCGTVRGIAAEALVKGKTTQCRNCGNRQKAALRSRLTHGQSDTRLHGIWMMMRRRCQDARYPDFHRYGGRGIAVCDEWQSFHAFYVWATSHGYTEDLTIDRINNDLGYSPANCRWATRTAQNRNRRNNIRYNWKGRSLMLSEIAEIEGVPKSMLSQRIRRGWPLEQAVSLPSGIHLRSASK